MISLWLYVGEDGKDRKAAIEKSKGKYILYLNYGTSKQYGIECNSNKEAEDFIVGFIGGAKRIK